MACLAFVVVGTSVGVSGVARAAEPAKTGDPESKELTWRGTEYHPVEAVTTVVAGVGALAVIYGAKAADQPRITGGVLFDDAIRDGLRLRDPSARDAARTISDVTTLAVLGLALGVDSILIPLVRGKPSVALRMVLVDLEAIALNGFITPSMYFVTARARPSREDCIRDPNFDPLCFSGSNASFWSGHTAQAFSAAGISCSHHAYLHLLGGGAPDALACAGAITLAATTGTMRLMGDRHYATDVLMGSLVGFGIGYGVPTLLHYFPYKHGYRAQSSLSLRPFATIGLGIDGTF